MRLLLRETVDQLGTIGDIVDVAPGYGRNYLLPKGIAVAVTPENVRRLDAKKADLLAAEAKKRAEMQAIADKMKATVVTIKARAAGDEGKLYGSVTAQQIADAFKAAGCQIDARTILMDQPIKEIGEFDIRIRVYAGIEVEAKLIVADEAGQVGGPKAEEPAAVASSEKREKAKEGRKPKKEEAAPAAEAKEPVAAKK